jgi:hypothetical protein
LSEDIKNNGTPETPAEPSTKQDRKEYMAQYYAENKAEIAERRKAARLARQEEINAADRETYANDPAARERRLKTNAKGRQTQKERLATDPETQQKHKERLEKRRQRHQERLATDPAYQKQREEFTTAVREKRKKQKNEGDKP